MGRCRGWNVLGFPSGTHVSEHISSDLLCTGFRFPLLLHQETVPGLRGHRAHPTGTVGASVWGFLLLLYGWIPRAKPSCGCPSGKLSPCSKQLPQSSPAGSVQHPTGLAYPEAFIPKPQRVCMENWQMPDSGRNCKPGWHPGTRITSLLD